MNTLLERFKKIICEQKRIVVATSLRDKPITRIFSFIFDDKRKVVYFITKKDADISKEIIRNHNVCVTTIPEYGKAHVRICGLAVKSNLKIADVKSIFLTRNITNSVLQKVPNEELQLYEVRSQSCDVYDDNYEFEVLNFFA